MMETKPPFKPGDPVTLQSFQTAAGKIYPRVDGLTVEAVTLESDTWRVKAGKFAEAWVGPAGLFEGALRVRVNEPC